MEQAWTVLYVTQEAHCPMEQVWTVLYVTQETHCSMASFDVHFSADILASCI